MGGLLPTRSLLGRPVYRYTPSQGIVSPKEFLSRIQSFPAEDVRRAKDVVLGGGGAPQTPRERDRFLWLVWLILQGDLIPQTRLCELLWPME